MTSTAFANMATALQVLGSTFTHASAFDCLTNLECSSQIGGRLYVQPYSTTQMCSSPSFSNNRARISVFHFDFTSQCSTQTDDSFRSEFYRQAQASSHSLSAQPFRATCSVFYTPSFRHITRSATADVAQKRNEHKPFTKCPSPPLSIIVITRHAS